MFKNSRKRIAKLLLICMFSQFFTNHIYAFAQYAVLAPVIAQILTTENVVSLFALAVGSLASRNQPSVMLPVLQTCNMEHVVNHHAETHHNNTNLVIGVLENSIKSTIMAEQQAAGISHIKLLDNAFQIVDSADISQQPINHNLIKQAVQNIYTHVIQSTVLDLAKAENQPISPVRAIIENNNSQQLLGNINQVTYIATSYDQRGTAVVGFSTPRTQPAFAVEASNEYMARQLFEIYHLNEAKTEYRMAIECMLNLNHPDINQRIIARLQLPALTFNGAQNELFQKTIDQLVPYYFTDNGHLRYELNRTNIPQQHIQKLLTQLTHDNKYAEFHRYYGDSRMALFNQYSGDIHLNPVHSESMASREKILANPYNAKIMACIKAFYDGDLETARTIKEYIVNNFQNIQRQQDEWHWSFAKEDYKNNLVHAHNVAQRLWSHNYYAIFDAQGVFKNGLNDPIFRQISEKDLKLIVSHKDRLKNLNTNLMVRHIFKSQLQQSWNIADSAPQEVHDALYQIIGKSNNDSALRDTPTLIHKVIELSSTSNPHHEKIAKEFFLPNGIMKEFAHYPRTRFLSLPESIHAPENIYLKRMLNNLVYVEHSMPNTPLATCAEKSIEFIQKSLTCDNLVIKQMYQDLTANIYQELTTKQAINYHSIVKDTLLPIVCDESINNHHAVMHEFFSAQGILKEFAQWPEAQVSFSSDLRSADSVHARNFLNQLVFAQHHTTDHQLKNTLQASLDSLGERLDAASSSYWHDAITWYTAKNIDLNISKQQQGDLSALGLDLPSIINTTEPQLIKALKHIDPLWPSNSISDSNAQLALQAISNFVAHCEITKETDSATNAPVCGTAASAPGKAENLPQYGCGTGNTISDGAIDADRPACIPNTPTESALPCGTGTAIKAEPEVPAECNWSKQHDLPPLMDEQEIEVEITTEPPQPELEDSNNINRPEYSLPPDEQNQLAQENQEDTTRESDTATSLPLAEEVVTAEGKLCVNQLDKEPLDVSESKNVINEACKKKPKINIKTFLSNISDPEVRKFLENTIKKWHEQINKPHCKEHGKLLQKGKHIYLPIQLESVAPDAKDWEKLSKVFDGTISVVTPNGERVPVWIDYQHLLTPAIKVNCETGETDLAGFHHDYLEKIAHSGALDFRVIERYEDGTYDAEWSYNGSESKPSTFFPSNWTSAKVIQVILEAIGSSISQEKRQQSSNRFVIIGITEDGLKIEVIIEVNNKESSHKAKLISAYPVRR